MFFVIRTRKAGNTNENGFLVTAVSFQAIQMKTHTRTHERAHKWMYARAHTHSLALSYYHVYKFGCFWKVIGLQPHTTIKESHIKSTQPYPLCLLTYRNCTNSQPFRILRNPPRTKWGSKMSVFENHMSRLHTYTRSYEVTLLSLGSQFSPCNSSPILLL